jgi:predicted nuclease with TOPRIM domain
MKQLAESLVKVKRELNRVAAEKEAATRQMRDTLNEEVRKYQPQITELTAEEQTLKTTLTEELEAYYSLKSRDLHSLLHSQEEPPVLENIQIRVVPFVQIDDASQIPDEFKVLDSKKIEQTLVDGGAVPGASLGSRIAIAVLTKDNKCTK